MARPASKRLLRSLGVTSMATFTGVTAISLSTRPSAPDTRTAVRPLQRTSSGDIIPPTFPKPKSRAQNLADLRQSSTPDSGSINDNTEYDLLVIGAGATGSGIALDAATRGLRVALVDRDDFSSGASSKSTKLVHGGVRYLEKAVWNLDYGQFSLVKEALRERKAFLNAAPHLTRSLPILLPVDSEQWWKIPYFWLGAQCYDFLATIQGQGIERSYFMARRKALENFPLLKRDIAGALVYYDGQQDDSRMNVSLAVTAGLYGATVVNHLEVTALEKDGNGKICGAKVRDVIASDDGGIHNEFNVRSKGVINATGPFADSLLRMDGTLNTEQPKELVAPSEGVHVVLPSHLGSKSADMGMLDASTSDGRVMFILPWQGNLIAGTTDTTCTVTQSPEAKEQDIKFILKEISKYLSPEAQLSRKDVLAAWSGIRPLMRDPHSSNTESLVRSHLVTVSKSGLLTCAGGKWTTYRQMAEDAVDKAIAVFNLKSQPLARSIDVSGSFAAHEERLLDGKCQTLNLRVMGAHGYTSSMFLDLMNHFGLDSDIAQHLARSYGDRAWEVAKLGPSSPSETPTGEKTVQLNHRISPKYPFTTGEIRYCVQNEYAQTAADILARRTRLSFLDVEAALEALPTIVDTMSQELHWNRQRKEKEWQQTLRFLGTMGLDEEMWRLTRDEVVTGRWRQQLPHSMDGAISKGGKQPIVVGAESESEDTTLPVPLPA